jgi:predicted DsbA family dithiol-disulfide isomerase
MVIDVISDVVCPWCYIGKRNLEAALETWRQQHPDEAVPQVNWHPFQLNPGLPESGMPRAQYIADKFGGPERAKEIYARVSNAGATAGIAFNFDGIVRQPNTVNPHRLIHLAGEQGKQEEMVEALFRGYFLDQADLTSNDTLANIAATAGMDREQVSAYLATDQDKPLVENGDHRARTIGVQGVPFFIFNQRYALSGAQPPEVLLDVMQKASEEVAAVPQ